MTVIIIPSNSLFGWLQWLHNQDGMTGFYVGFAACIVIASTMQAVLWSIKAYWRRP